MKLSDTHLVILSVAAQREDHIVELSKDIEGAVAEKLVARLCGAGLIEEISAGPNMPVWRVVDDQSFTLRITDAGLRAINAVDPEHEKVGGRAEGTAAKENNWRKAKAAKSADRKPVQSSKAGSVPKSGNDPHLKGRRAGKLDQVRTLLSRKSGATIEQMMQVTNWLPHSTRAVLTGLRKKGFEIERQSTKDKVTVYRIVRSPETSSPNRLAR